MDWTDRKTESDFSGTKTCPRKYTPIWILTVLHFKQGITSQCRPLHVNDSSVESSYTEQHRTKTRLLQGVWLFSKWTECSLLRRSLHRFFKPTLVHSSCSFQCDWLFSLQAASSHTGEMHCYELYVVKLWPGRRILKLMNKDVSFMFSLPNRWQEQQSWV